MLLTPDFLTEKTENDRRRLSATAARSDLTNSNVLHPSLKGPHIEIQVVLSRDVQTVHSQVNPLKTVGGENVFLGTIENEDLSARRDVFHRRPTSRRHSREPRVDAHV
jgi:hypothetical protein